jgi:hypothetical protein
MAQPPSFYERPGQTGQLPTPIATGAPIAEGVDAVARAVSGAQASERETDQRVRQSELEDARIERERALQLQTGDTAAYLAEQAGNLQADLIKMREQTAPGAAGYEEQVEARIGKFRDDVTERVGTDPELHARFVDNIASVATNARVGELTWAATQRAKKSATTATRCRTACRAISAPRSRPAPSTSRCWPTPTGSTSARSRRCRSAAMRGLS